MKSPIPILHKISEDKTEILIHFITTDKPITKGELAQFINTLYHIHNDMRYTGDKN